MKQRLRGIIIALSIIGNSGVLLLISSPSNVASAAPAVHWEVDAVNAEATRGEHTERDIRLEAVETLGSINLRISPEIAPFVVVTPSTLSNVEAGDSVSIRISIQAGLNAPTGVFDGVIQARQITSDPARAKVFARPLPVRILIREAEGIAGTDADANGVWDYIDRYINETYPDSDQVRAGLRQHARAIEGGLLHAEDKDLSLRYAGDMDRAIECVFFLRPNDAGKVLGDLKAAILNTKVRSRAFVLFSEQSVGQVFPSAPVSERASSCVAQ